MCIREFLQSRHVWFETMLHPPAPSASKLAQSIHVSGRHVAKAVLVEMGGTYRLAVLPATARIDLDRLAQVLDGQDVRIATEDEVEHVFGDCERGALPPFGRLYGLTTLVDTSLSGGSEIVFVGNTRHEGVRMRYRDYEALEGPVRARFALATSPRRRRTSHRQAG
jgi:Ala-tRNA(Pro) deacylase